MRIFIGSICMALLAFSQTPESLPESTAPSRNPAHFPKQRGIPIPSRGKKKPAATAPAAITHTINGALRRLDASEIILTADDARTITAKRVPGTRFVKGGKAVDAAEFRPGDRVSLGANRDDEGYFHAVSVTFEREGTESERTAAAAPVNASGQVSEMERRPVLRRAGGEAAEPEPDAEDEEQATAEHKPVTGAAADPNRPRLRRGKPAPRAARVAGPELAEAQPPQPPAAPWKVAPTVEQAEKQRSLAEDPRIAKAREVVASYTESLPNYFCQQHITRYVSSTQPANWRAQDVITAALIFEKGQERYTNLTVNGKPVQKTLEEMGGTWSKGEFGSLLADLFHPSTDALFRLGRNTTISGRSAVIFDFEVEQRNSHWVVNAPSQSLNPAYKGSVWLDSETSQVLRVELQGWKLPREFPFSVIESAVDFSYTRIADRQFLVPTHAEVLSCARGSSFCSRNVIDFRNYRKFDGESTIRF